MLPVPVEGYPSHGVQHPEDGEIQPIEGRDITRASTTRTITWEAISEAYLVWHQDVGPALWMRQLKPTSPRVP